jgi:branched-chain amino acid transport system permease protein
LPASLAWLAATPKLWGFLLLLAAVPAVVGDAYVLQVLCLAMLWTVFASSWNLAVGYAGLKTFGHQAFFGIGAYVSALTSMHGGLSPWLTMWIGAAAAAGVGALVALPLLRIRSLPHLAIVTLAFAEIVRITCSNLVGLTRGELGLSGIAPFTAIPLPWGGELRFGPADRAASYVMIWTMTAATLLFLAWFVRSRTGLIVQSIRDSQVAAESLGVNLTRTKLLVLSISAFIAGAAGAVYAHFVLVLTPTSAMGIALMVQMTAITLVGGIGTLQGPLIGALVLTLSAEGLRLAGDHRMLVFGLLIILVVLFAPRGLARLDVLIADLGRWRAAGSRS